MNHLYQRHCLRLQNFTSKEINNILQLSQTLKQRKKNNQETQLLKKKNIVLIFEKESTRTRCAFEIAAFDQGANVTYLGPGSTHIGTKESIEDTAKVLGRLYDGIQYRGHDHDTIEILSKHSQVPVWNGLTEKFHPTQLLADLLTIKEIFPKKTFSEITCAYVGDAQNNISNSLLEAASLLGFNLRLVAPKKYWPEKHFLLLCQNNRKKNQAKIVCTENIKEGVKDVDFIYTDVWISMGEPNQNWNKKIQLLKDYQVNDHMLNITNNPEVKVLHCLPAIHNKNTYIEQSILNKHDFQYGMEITDNVFKKHQKTIFEQAENRLHTIKALILSSLIQEIKF